MAGQYEMGIVAKLTVHWQVVRWWRGGQLLQAAKTVFAWRLDCDTSNSCLSLAATAQRRVRQQNLNRPTTVPQKHRESLQRDVSPGE